MAEIDHDAAIALVRLAAARSKEPGGPEILLYVADLAERAKELEEALQEAVRLYVTSSDVGPRAGEFCLIANHPDCGPWINRARALAPRLGE